MSKVEGKELKEIDENDLKDPKVVTKYQQAGLIAQKVLNSVIGDLEGKSITEICKRGNASILEHSKKIYKNLTNGIAFPVTCAVGDEGGHVTESDYVIKTGDLVRVELGVHIDGYIAQAGKTVVVGDAEVEGQQADLLKALDICMDAALRLIKPGKEAGEFQGMLEKICADFGVGLTENMVSQQVLRNIIDGPLTIHQHATDSKQESFKFELGQVFTISLLLTTSLEGKTRKSTKKATIYKRNPNVTYQLKLASSRKTFSQIQKRFGAFPFVLSDLDDDKTSRMGIIECASHALVTPYEVFCDADGGILANKVVTVMLMANGPLVLSPEVVAHYPVKSEKKESEEVSKLLEESVRVVKKK